MASTSLASAITQVISTASSIATATASPTPTPTPTQSSSNPSQSGGSGNNSSNQSSSPLLFFVALGFGVVFTNLWIIVGVKYCFRYNARNRARGLGDDGVDLQALARPHRRRREKKLMTMDEVNERFPATKYKTWRATREALGLSTAGGIAATDSTIPASPTSNTAVKTVTVTSNDVNPTTPPMTTVTPEPPAATITPEIAPQIPNTLGESRPISLTVPSPVADPTNPSITNDPRHSTDENNNAPKRVSGMSDLDRQRTNATEDEIDDDAVAAVPADMAQTPGDTCAICIDVIEDADDVRGLTCGHAFHTVCLDPWLTSRRACCPLCKHDYYVPKPRTEAEIEAEEAARERRREAAAAEQAARYPGGVYFQRLQTALFPGSDRRNRSNANNRRRGGGGGAGGGVGGGRNGNNRGGGGRRPNQSSRPSPEAANDNAGSGVGRFMPFGRRSPEAPASNAAGAANEGSGGRFFSRFRRGNAEAGTTPGQLEAQRA